MLEPIVLILWSLAVELSFSLISILASSILVY